MALGGFFQTILEDSTGLFIQAIFQSLAAGTFIYIAAQDFIHEEFFHKRAGWWELILSTLALCVMALLILVE